MKKGDEISQLTLAWKFGESMLVYLKNGDNQRDDPAVLVYSLMFKSFHVSNLKLLLKLASFERVNYYDEGLQNYYRDQIYGIMPENMILESLVAFETR